MASLAVGLSPLVPQHKRRFARFLSRSTTAKRLLKVAASSSNSTPTEKGLAAAPQKIRVIVNSSSLAAVTLLLGWTQNAGIAGATGRDLVDRAAYPEYSLEQWIVILVAWGGVAFLYFIFAPPVIYAYLHTRWLKRSKYEAFFHFFLVFSFFPALLLWAPFINLRPLPTDPTKKYPWE